ncbi:MAG: hypothetical protein QGH15_12375 [Kiritimatiellia bacterium]|nr:hypothetical protein [Kiritimatiellia bacterium]
MTIPEGWQRLRFDDALSMLASLGDADHTHHVTGGISAQGGLTTG